MGRRLVGGGVWGPLPPAGCGAAPHGLVVAVSPLYKGGASRKFDQERRTRSQLRGKRGNGSERSVGGADRSECPKSRHLRKSKVFAERGYRSAGRVYDIKSIKRLSPKLPQFQYGLNIMITSELDNFKEFFKEMKNKVEIDFSDEKWHINGRVPNKPGWYTILTNTLIDSFAGLYKTGKLHCNYTDQYNSSIGFNEAGLLITPNDDNEQYVVYSGEAKSLRDRAKQHYNGHKKTGCLALMQQKSLHAFQWEFAYSTCEEFYQYYQNSPDQIRFNEKRLQIFGEQVWRSIHGWPTLCSK
ncbi:hypothetical protein [Magnetofaba australis]|uniref:hypothetical protein n=1 Tax=Magnetofaba australis TaxID=1472297 RepID=UPI00117DFD05|nr:hypothetical protein [Magnetofaba australis]